MAQFKVVQSGTTYLIESLGNTSQMKNIMNALSDIDSENGKGGWEQVKEAFEKFGFTVCYDRNLALLTVALFAAIARSKCQELITNAKFIINIKVKNKQGETISLGQAFLNGDGYSIYAILNHPTFKKILKALGISDKYIKKYLDRLKKITPWKLSGSKKYLEVISKAFEDMTGEKLDLDLVEITPITEIKTEWDFKQVRDDRNKIRIVNISDGIKAIPDSAFDDYRKLQEVNIPNSVTKIGKNAFKFCSFLKKIRIPESVKIMGNGIFFGCSRLEEVEFLAAVTVIPGFTFCLCENLKEITIPSSVTEIEKEAFEGCPKDMKILGNPKPEIKAEIEKQIGKA